MRLVAMLMGRRKPDKTDVDLLWVLVLCGALVVMMLVLGRGEADAAPAANDSARVLTAKPKAEPHWRGKWQSTKAYGRAALVKHKKKVWVRTHRKAKRCRTAEPGTGAKCWRVWVRNGKNGSNGSNGTNGSNGKNGADGQQGPPGAAGTVGPQGAAGVLGYERFTDGGAGPYAEGDLVFSLLECPAGKQPLGWAWTATGVLTVEQVDTQGRALVVGLVASAEGDGTWSSSLVCATT